MEVTELIIRSQPPEAAAVVVEERPVLVVMRQLAHMLAGWVEQ